MLHSIHFNIAVLSTTVEDISAVGVVHPACTALFEDLVDTLCDVNVRTGHSNRYRKVRVPSSIQATLTPEFYSNLRSHCEAAVRNHFP